MNPQDPISHRSNESFGSVIKEVSNAAKHLMSSEVELMKAELKSAAPKIARHGTQTAVFGALAVSSVFPFLAFLVIGLGEMMNGNFWLSALVVAIVWAVVAGSLAYLGFQKLKNEDLGFHHTREAIDHTVDLVQKKMKDVTQATQGGQNGTRELH